MSHTLLLLVAALTGPLLAQERVQKICKTLKQLGILNQSPRTEENEG